MNKKQLLIGMGFLLSGYVGYNFYSAKSLESKAEQIGWTINVPIFGDRSQLTKDMDEGLQLHPLVEDLKKRAKKMGWDLQLSPPYRKNRIDKLVQDLEKTEELYPKVAKLEEELGIQFTFPYHQNIFTNIEKLKENKVNFSDIKYPLESHRDFYTIDFSKAQLPLLFELFHMAPVQKIPAGRFTMGCIETDEQCPITERGTAKIRLTRDFYMMETEVTQEFYAKVLQEYKLRFDEDFGAGPIYRKATSDPSQFKGDNNPVESIYWYFAIEFANKLSKLEGREECYIFGGSWNWPDKSCTGWRLPTEAEWEYAARAPAAATQGASAKYPKYAARGGEYHLYAGSNNLEEVAEIFDYKNGIRPPVRQKKPNAFGLYDMSGSVAEYCWSKYFDVLTSDSLLVDPIIHAGSPNIRVVRGDNIDPRVSTRYGYKIFEERSPSVGFRLVHNVH